MFVSPAYAQAAGGAGGAGAIAQFIPLILIFVIMYFLILRPQQKRAREHRDMVAALKRGDQVVTNGGLIGKITDVKDEELTVEVAQGVKVRIVRGSVAQVVSTVKPVAANS
ncbi:preprotein translocase subunit YajC [Paracoccus jeotgali]|uniref:Sec translocon accessory complex subunit YajC n=1 Tax=Paracoccus jeotgali TaxID=2065379 RepID=A0A2K9MCH7_9RHOB|nr:preprotein translocase subunit YajC [Paracoccus jeotgali]AUM73212.1 preprotein translocase subunit YajC [Paracoccus jeotgali]